MTQKTIKIPGPDHPITIEPNPHRVVVTLGGREIANTTAALTLREANYPAVQYVPREDVDMTALERTDHGSYCPYKGDSALPRALLDRRMRSGATRRPIMPSLRSGHTSPSTPTASMG